VFFIATSLFCPNVGGAQVAAEPRVSVDSAWLTRADSGAGEQLVAGPRPEGAEQLLHTLRFRYEGSEPADTLLIVHAVPAGEHYVADSATGPRATISYSVDGGRSFAAPGMLRLALDAADPAATGERAATPTDYSHIRWELPGPHPPGRAGLVSFRARIVVAEPGAGGAAHGVAPGIAWDAVPGREGP